jgi:glycosyltransferase involved in cell wall biosynthesis
MPTARTDPPRISVVIATYNRAERLRPLLLELSRQSLPPGEFEVVVVDNCSDDNTGETLRTLVPVLPYHLELAATPSNHGPAAARNLGWKLARSPLLAFLDDDVLPRPEWLEAGLAALLRNPRAGVIQGRTTVPDGVDLGQCSYGPPRWDLFHVIDAPTAHFEACNIFFRKEVMEATGGFDEVIGWWGEDTAAGWRALEAGWERDFAIDAVVTHPVEQRGWSWFMRNGLRERNFVQLGVDHPGFRAAFWRPWSFRREDAAFVAALVGALAALRFRPALLIALPYLWWRRPSVRHLSFIRLCVQIPAVDGARVVGHLRGSLDSRTLVL